MWREVWDPLSLPARFSTFLKNKCIFSIALVESFEEVARVFLTEKHSSDTGCKGIGC